MVKKNLILSDNEDTCPACGSLVGTCECDG